MLIYFTSLHSYINILQGMLSATGSTAFLPETDFMMVAMVILAVQLLVIILTCTVACGLVCYCRRKPVKGKSQRKGKWITFNCVHGPHSLWCIGKAPGGYHAIM